MAAPNPAPAKNTPSTNAPAAIFHRTHADTARAISESTRIQRKSPRKIPHASQRLSLAQPASATLDSMKNRIRPGTQVISDKRAIKTLNFPATYSPREKGRHRYSGSAPLTKSGETRLGP